MWQVTAIKYGMLASTRGELFLDYATVGDPEEHQELAYYLWLLRDSEGRVVLVDTGFDPAVGQRRGRTVVKDPLGALADAGCWQSDVEAVVLSHFHYDHIGNVRAFPKAAVHVPRRELEFWGSPASRHPHVLHHVEDGELGELYARSARGGLSLYGGGDEIMPGLTAVELAGHTPGHHGFLVETSRGPLLLAVDAVHFLVELERGWPFAVFVDLDGVRASYRTVQALVATTGALLVPGHDPVVPGDDRRDAGAGIIFELA